MLFDNLVAEVHLDGSLENNHIWDHFSIFDTLLTFFVDLAAVNVITVEDCSGGGLSDGNAVGWGRRRPIGMRARKKVLLYMG